MIFVLFFAFATSALLFVLGQSIFSDLADLSRLADGKRALLVSESLTDDVTYRLVFGTFSVDDEELLTMGGVSAWATTTYDSPADIFIVDTTARARSTVRKSWAELSLGAGSAFNYGLQAGTGGIALSNSASVIGNVYANGPVIGQGSATVYGDLVSAGPSGLAKDITATGTIWANTIDGIDAGGDAHFNVQIGNNAQNPVAGTRFTPVINQPTTTFPISTTTIQEWKDAVVDHGTVIAAADPLCSSGTYTINTSMTIGYLKVECDLDIRSTGPGVTVTVDGPVWVEGDIAFLQGPVIRAHPSLGRRSVQFIADNETNRLTSSKIEIRNSTNFFGTGDDRSYILLLSNNESASLGGTEEAIFVGQSANGDVLVYTNDGLVEIGNNIDLRSVTGYRLDIANGSSVTYETGLASLLFTSGPGGGYVLNDWQQGE